MQIRVPESEDLINLDIVNVRPDKSDLIVYFDSLNGGLFAWSFETEERFNEVLEKVQSFYKEL